MPFAGLSFLGAFLLFVLEPMVGKAVLPYFGGGAGVWLACLVYFQMTLLAGYVYAHYLVRLAKRSQQWIHGGLLLAAIVCACSAVLWKGGPFLPGPELPGAGLKPPSLAILAVLTLSSGLGFLVLAATSPLVQFWYAHADRSSEPYRLYSVSNWGSLAGLLSYPLLVEPFIDLHWQAWAFLSLFLGYGVLIHRLQGKLPESPTSPPTRSSGTETGHSVSLSQALRWMGLSGLGTIWLLAITGKLSTDIASIPLMWVPPLGIYLLTFIAVFDGRWDFTQRWVRLLLSGVLLAFSLVLGLSSFISLPNQTLNTLAPHFSLGLLSLLSWIYGHAMFGFLLSLGALFAACTLCHFRLAESRPEAAQLTAFYLYLALGGLIGGLLVSVAAPMLFNQNYELPLAVIATAGLSLLGFQKNRGDRSWLGIVLASVTLAVMLVYTVEGWADTREFHARDFFGTVRVYRPYHNLIQMSQGNTVHGIQFAEEPLRPASYYGINSGFGRAMRLLQAERPTLNVGIIGLGVGKALAYGRAGDRFVVYEISPKVIQLSGLQGEIFSVARSTPAHVEIQEGDGRILLTQDLAKGERFDLILVDAFAGGHIPVHLLTQQALQVYLSGLKPGGILALHVSHHLPLDEAVGAGLQVLGVPSVEIRNEGTVGVGRNGQHIFIEPASVYWLCSRQASMVYRRELLAATAKIAGPGLSPQEKMAGPQEGIEFFGDGMEQRIPWTDERSSLLPLLFH